MSKINVVVVGGGYGAVMARGLSAKLDSSKYNLILINNRPFRIHNIAGLRMAVAENEALEKQAMLSYDRLFQNGKGEFKLGAVVSIEKTGETGGKVVLEDGESVVFGVLVLATGSNWPGPIDYPVGSDGIAQLMKQTRREIKEASNIVLVGGGAVGLELSGEIKDVYPDKNITIVHSGAEVLNPAYPDKFRTFTGDNFRSRGIEFVLDDLVEDMTIHDQSVITKKGKKISADLVISTRGPTPNTGMIISSLGASAASATGYIKVKSTLQLPDHPDIFAMGDILDLPEQKGAIKAGNHATLVAANIVSYLAGRQLKAYAQGKEVILVCNGKNKGTAYLGMVWGMMLGDWMVRMAKGKALLVSIFASEQGY